MKDSFKRLHPAVLLIYFAMQAVLTAVCFHPLTIGVSMTCALMFIAITASPASALRWLLMSALYMVCFGVINPLINHQGETVLFLFLNRRITLQSICYGVLTGAMVSAMCLWLYLMGKSVDSKKAVYLFGKTLPSITLMVFMSVRLIKRYQQKTEEILDTRKGLYQDEGRLSMVKETAGTLLTFGLENGVDTADSMSARGYGCHKPTSYYDYYVTVKDIISAVILFIAAAVILFGVFNGCCKMYFFPKFFVEASNPIVFAAYFVMCAYPLFMFVWSEIRWLYLK